MRKIKNPFTLFIQFFHHKIISAHYCSSVNGKSRFDNQLLSACSLLSFCNIGQMVKTECCVQISPCHLKNTDAKKKKKEILPGCKLRKNDDRHLWTAWLWLFKISNLINRDIQNNWRCLLIMTNQFSLSNQPLFWDEWACHNMEIRFVLLSWLCFIDYGISSISLK